MADDLSTAPQTGNSEPVSAPASDSAPSSAPAKEAPAKAPSTREALKEAMRTVAAREPNETDKAGAVLKDGAGADEALSDADRKAKGEASDTIAANREASERAKKGWETRKANEAKASEDAKQAETIGKVVGEKVAEAVKPAETAPKAEEAKPATQETKYKEPPQRFAQPAKAEWDKVPEAVKAEIDRALSENEKGIQKYKAGAEQWEGLAEYEQLSRQFYNQPLKDTLKNYADLDRGLGNPETQLATLERLVSGMKYTADDGKQYNWDLPTLAQYILEQTDQGINTFQNPHNDLQRELSDLKRELAELRKGEQERETQRLQQERERTTTSLQKQIEDFARKAPRFDELWSDVELELHNPKFAAGEDPIVRLQKAYEKVERLNPAPSLSPPAPDLPAQDTAAQTRKGTASITGAPQSGSNPAGRKPVPSSSREALKAAFAAKGLSLS